MVVNVLQYMYELEYNTDGAEDKVPNIYHHACVWDAGDKFGIKGLKLMAADQSKVALSHFNTYGTEMNFTFLFFEDFVKTVEAVWIRLVSKSNRILRS